MKVVINRCYGGFGLSPAAIKRIAELQGRPCYFFSYKYGKGYKQLTEAEAATEFCVFAFDETPAQEGNDWYEKHDLDNWRNRRDDDLLVQVVEELGQAANGRHAKLKVVEIPDGVDWGISEYEGLEHVAETHRTW